VGVGLIATSVYSGLRGSVQKQFCDRPLVFNVQKQYLTVLSSRPLKIEIPVYVAI
jgi:hypothetical protein